MVNKTDVKWHTVESTRLDWLAENWLAW